MKLTQGRDIHLFLVETYILTYRYLSRANHMIHSNHERHGMGTCSRWTTSDLWGSSRGRALVQNLLIRGHERRKPRSYLGVVHNESMFPADGEITHVSDTALMVAACRAHETQMEDAFVRDPFAARLAGERGPAILRGLPFSAVLRLSIAIRTRFVDELLLETLSLYPITTVLSVGCGLDTRPWRISLAPNLRWIEVDFADVLNYKDRLMAGETPTCRRERLTIDLNDSERRRTLYEVTGLSPCADDHRGLTHVSASRHRGGPSRRKLEPVRCRTLDQQCYDQRVQ